MLWPLCCPGRILLQLQLAHLNAPFADLASAQAASNLASFALDVAFRLAHLNAPFSDLPSAQAASNLASAGNKQLKTKLPAGFNSGYLGRRPDCYVSLGLTPRTAQKQNRSKTKQL